MPPRRRLKDEYADYLINAITADYMPDLKAKLLKMCGSGSHPRPGVSMAPGRNAAEAICSGLDLEFQATASTKAWSQ